MTIPSAEDYLAICEVKARYCRFLDHKDWAGYADVFTQDAVLDTRASGGKMASGREALVALVRTGVEDAITVHQVHSPEISMTGPDTAKVVWAMQDRVIWNDERAQAIGKRSLAGFGHYHEDYCRCDDGNWRISLTKLTRLHLDFEPLETDRAE